MQFKLSFFLRDFWSFVYSVTSVSLFVDLFWNLFRIRLFGKKDDKFNLTGIYRMIIFQIRILILMWICNVSFNNIFFFLLTRIKGKCEIIWTKTIKQKLIISRMRFVLGNSWNLSSCIFSILFSGPAMNKNWLFISYIALFCIISSKICRKNLVKGGKKKKKFLE